MPIDNEMWVFITVGGPEVAWPYVASCPCERNGFGVGPSGEIYIGDPSTSKVLKYSSTGTALGAWGSPGSGVGEFEGLGPITCDGSGNVYVASSDGRIQKFTGDGEFLTQWGSSGTADGQFLGNPEDLAVDSAGNIFVLDNNRVQKFGYITTATLPTTWGRLKLLYR